MRFKILVFVGLTSLMFAAPALAAPCCDKAPMPCCDKASMPDMAAKPCCDSAVDVLLSLDRDAAAPAKQVTEVWFQRPVIVERHILQGRYLIEHDNGRMARGEPCTYIYAYGDRTKPIVTFHCVHLMRDVAGQDTVVLHSTSDGWQKLEEFQFKGEIASHGVPTER